MINNLIIAAQNKNSSTAGWIKMPLGTEVNLGPGDVVSDGVAAPPKRGTVPQFRFMSIVAKRLDGCRHHWYGSKPSPRPRPHYIRRGPSSSRKGHSSPLSPSFRPMSIVATVANLSYCRALVHDFYRCAALNYTSRALHPTEKNKIEHLSRFSSIYKGIKNCAIYSTVANRIATRLYM